MGTSVVVFGRGRGRSGATKGVGEEIGRGDERTRVGMKRGVVGGRVVGGIVISRDVAAVDVVGRSSAANAK